MPRAPESLLLLTWSLTDRVHPRMLQDDWQSIKPLFIFTSVLYQPFISQQSVVREAGYFSFLHYPGLNDRHFLPCCWTPTQRVMALSTCCVDIQWTPAWPMALKSPRTQTTQNAQTKFLAIRIPLCNHDHAGNSFPLTSYIRTLLMQHSPINVIILSYLLVFCIQLLVIGIHLQFMSYLARLWLLTHIFYWG